MPTQVQVSINNSNLQLLIEYNKIERLFKGSKRALSIYTFLNARLSTLLGIICRYFKKLVEEWSTVGMGHKKIQKGTG